jgi:hypothetical protein
VANFSEIDRYLADVALETGNWENLRLEDRVSLLWRVW